MKPNTFILVLTVVAVVALLAAIALPNFVRARTSRSLSSCLDVNLGTIAKAKERWANENGKGPGSIPTEQDLMPYLPNNKMPVCFMDGTYTIGPVGTAPSCSFNHGQ